MVINGRKRAANYTLETIGNEWLNILDTQIIPAYNHWLTLGARHRSLFYLARTLGYFNRIL